MKQNWYKVVIDHGPGHQSRTVWFRHSTPKQIRDEIENWNFNWPIFRIRKLNKLPVDVKKSLMKTYTYQFNSARAMLTLLKNS